MWLSFIHTDTQHSQVVVKDKPRERLEIRHDWDCSYISIRKICLSSEGAPDWAPSAFCILNLKRAVNSVFTHGSFHWIKARGCCVSLDSHQYAWWILMSCAHCGERGWHTYSVLSQLCITLTICLRAQTQTNTHEEVLIKPYSACTDVHARTHTCTFCPHWRIQALEGRVIVTCRLTVVAGGDPQRLLFKVMVYLSNVKP